MKKYTMSKPADISFGERLAILRKRAGLSRKELAEIMEVSYVTISNYENDKTQPDINIMYKLSIALGVTMNMLLRGNEPKRTYPPLV